MTILGKPYIELFGRSCLETTPVPILEKLDADIYCLQLSKTPFDFETNMETMDILRETAKEHLGSNAFFDTHKSKDHTYCVPKFELQHKGTPPPV